MDDAFKHLYETELTHLKTHAQRFAKEQRFRRLAGKVGLDPNTELRDPFVDWLLQGYAFLAARVQEKLGEEFPRFTQNLLSVVNPQLTAPTPAMIVAAFSMRADPALLSGPILKRGHVLNLPTRVAGTRARKRSVTFTTGRDVRLWPIEVTDLRYLPDQASLEAAGATRPAPAGIVMTLTLSPDEAVQDFPAEYLDLHVTNGSGIGALLFEAMVLATPQVEVQGTAKRRGTLTASVPIEVNPLGFERESHSPERGWESDHLLPYDPRHFDGFRLLHEFFALPDRFHFMRLTGLRKALHGKGERSFRVLFLLPRAFPGLAGKIGREAVRTNCVPAVNLFEHQPDDIQMNTRRVEHQILPDRGDPTAYEVHTVQSVIGRTKGGKDQIFRPFFATAGLGEPLDGPQRFYALNRQPRAVPALREERDKALDEYRGSEVSLSLVDEAAKPVSPDLKALSMTLLCTNRHLPLYARGATGADAELRSGSDEGWDAIHIISGPSTPRPGLPAGRRLWEAISHLSLNYLSLVETEGAHPLPGGQSSSAAALRQLMHLYVPDSPPVSARIADALINVSARQGVRQMAAADAGGRIAPITYARGLDVALTFADKTDTPGLTTTLAAVLDRFLAGYVSANSFTQTTMYQPQSVERLRWTPRSGSKTML